MSTIVNRRYRARHNIGKYYLFDPVTVNEVIPHFYDRDLNSKAFVISNKKSWWLPLKCTDKGHKISVNKRYIYYSSKICILIKD